MEGLTAKTASARSEAEEVKQALRSRQVRRKDAGAASGREDAATGVRPERACAGNRPASPTTLRPPPVSRCPLAAIPAAQRRAAEKPRRSANPRCHPTLTVQRRTWAVVAILRASEPTAAPDAALILCARPDVVLIICVYGRSEAAHISPAPFQRRPNACLLYTSPSPRDS